jgi:ABC-type phosphate/phosphonate transport system substrate-binding protein
MTLLMGAVAYDPKVVTIWQGFRSWLRAGDLPFDFILYSNYERQVEDLVDGHIHAAWNSPLAWLRASRLAAARGRVLTPLVMRDTDRDLTSVIVVRSDSPYMDLSDLKGEVVAVGAVDSPQATLIPCSHLRSLGLRPGEDVFMLRFDVGVGLHGDHIGGERDAARALVSGKAAAACMIDSNHLLFSREGILPAGRTRVLSHTAAFDHCNMTVAVDGAMEGLVRSFGRLLRSMPPAHPTVRRLFDLEGLTAWRYGRASGYALLEAAVREVGFYDEAGTVTAEDYEP